MPRIKFDQVGERRYETGCDHGVLYSFVDGAYKNGVPWNGLTSVASNPSGAEDTPYYADNIKYFNMKSAEEYGLTIGCFAYPDAFKKCNGELEVVPGMTLGQQNREIFGFSYRSKNGNDVEGQDAGFTIHLVYGCSASPSSKTYNTVNESPEPGEMSYEVSTTPVDVPGKAPNGKPYKPLSEITFESTKLDPDKLEMLEEILYGSDTSGISTLSSDTEAGPRLPMPEELMELMATTTKPDEPSDDDEALG